MRVLLGIPHALLREGLSSVLKRWSEVEIVGVSPSAAEAVRAAERLQPDVLLMSRSGSPAADARAVSAARDAVPGCSVVLVEDVGRSARDHALDVDWCVTPTVGPSGLMKGLWGLCVGRDASRSAGQHPPRPPRALVTGREYEVLRAVCEGFSNKELSRRLGISESTVKNHLSSIYRRTKVSGRTQLVLWAIERGLATSEGRSSRGE
ncbi:MAG: response regulator transcription factor [Armatimonadetes bacterium]|nr:response regulator transcription factor [Armatimonadota bacterium]